MRNGKIVKRIENVNKNGLTGLDNLYWTELCDHGSAALVNLDLSGRPIKKTELWVTGTLTPRAMKELKARV